MIKNAKHALLLSGTPAENRPGPSHWIGRWIDTLTIRTIARQMDSKIDTYIERWIDRCIARQIDRKLYN